MFIGLTKDIDALIFKCPEMFHGGFPNSTTGHARLIRLK
jgi:hypothetical protein